ncbi:hypothetical protein HYY74_03545 [Candidatus Woesearchaeota archaeon]|nr:hypothetical protein [Candidatus Woesearchaeota archaeon]
MKQLAFALGELRFGIGKVMLFELALDTLIVLLLSYLALSLLNMPLVFAASVTFAYFMALLGRQLSVNRIREVELFYPKLNEKLRTAAEYIRVDNPVVNELHNEVLSDLKGVEEAEFVDERDILAKAGVVAVLCFILILLAPVSISLEDFTPVLPAGAGSELNVTFDLGGEPGDSSVGLGGGKAGGGKIAYAEDIFGAPAIAKLGEEDVELRIKPAGDSINIREVREVEAREFQESYPKEVFAVSSAAFEERIPREQQEVVKNYFSAIAKG